MQSAKRVWVIVRVSESNCHSKRIHCERKRDRIEYRIENRKYIQLQQIYHIYLSTCISTSQCDSHSPQRQQQQQQLYTSCITNTYTYTHIYILSKKYFERSLNYLTKIYKMKKIRIKNKTLYTDPIFWLVEYTHTNTLVNVVRPLTKKKIWKYKMFFLLYLPPENLVVREMHL